MKTLGRRFLAAILAAAMLTTTAGAPVYAVETQEIVVTTDGSDTQKATQKNVPEETGKPDLADASEETKIMETEKAPEETKAPEPLDGANVTETTEKGAPETADTPEGTEAPETAPVSEETKVSEPLDGANVTETTEKGAPETAETPEGTEAPESVPVPEETKAPESLDGANVTEKGAPSEQPEETETQVQPETPAESEMTEGAEEIEAAEVQLLEEVEFYTLNDTFVVDGITYKEVGAGRARLMKGKDASGNLVIPEWVVKPGTEETYQVVSIEGWAFTRNTNLTGITFPESLTSIGSRAFSSCTSLTGNLVLPESLCELGEYAFYGCAGLQGDLRIPENLTRIGQSAFMGCSGLNGSLILNNNLTRIEEGTFYNCTGLQGTVVLPDGLTSIGAYAFYDCTGLQGTIALPDGLTSIGQYAFPNGQFIFETTEESVATLAYNTGYRTVRLNGADYVPKPVDMSVFQVGDFWWRVIDEANGYVALISPVNSSISGSVTVPASITDNGKTYRVTSINDYAFYNKSNITGINLPEGLLYIGESAFGCCSGLQGTLRLPSTLLGIGDYAFQDCSGLTGNLVLPDGLKSIGSYVFWRCSNLNGTLTLPKSLETIGKEAFFQCEKLRGSLVLPDTLTSIGESAFYYCYSLTGTLVIPDSVSVVGSSAFQLCRFTQYQVGEGLQMVGSSAFPSEGNLVVGSPRVQFLLVEYVGLDKVPVYFWDGKTEIPDGAIATADPNVTIDQDMIIYGDLTVREGVQVTIAPGAELTVAGSLNVAGTVVVEGILTSEGSIQVTATGEIIKREQDELVITDPGSKTYGDADFTLATEGGSTAAAVQWESSDPSVLSISGEKATIHKAGSVQIRAVKDGDYTFETADDEISVVIKPKKVTFRADSITIKKEAAIPSYTYTGTELAYGDQLETEPTLTCSRTDSGTVGEYPIEISGAVLTNQENYEIEYIPGILKITEKMSYHYSLVYSSSVGTQNMPEDQSEQETEATSVTFTISSEEPVRKGYIFKGWAVDGSSQKAEYQPGDTITLDASGADQDGKVKMTLMAVWEKTTSEEIEEETKETQNPETESETQKETEQKTEKESEAQKETEQKTEKESEAQKETEQKMEKESEAQKETEQKTEKESETQKETEQKTKKDAPKTGDSANIAWWGALAVISLLLLGILLKRFLKYHYHRQK